MKRSSLEPISYRSGIRTQPHTNIFICSSATLHSSSCRQIRSQPPFPCYYFLLLYFSSSSFNSLTYWYFCHARLLLLSHHSRHSEDPVSPCNTWKCSCFLCRRRWMYVGERESTKGSKRDLFFFFFFQIYMHHGSFSFVLRFQFVSWWALLCPHPFFCTTLILGSIASPSPLKKPAYPQSTNPKFTSLYGQNYLLHQ